MYELNMDALEAHFKQNAEVKYIAIIVHMPDFPKEELIINTTENFDLKLAYYKRVYNEDLLHKFSAGVRIVGYAASDDLNDLEELIQ